MGGSSTNGSSGAGFGLLQQVAVGGDEAGGLDDVALNAPAGSAGFRLPEKAPEASQSPWLRMADRQAPVVLALVLFEVAAEVHRRLLQQPPRLRQGGDEQAAYAVIAVRKGWMVKLGVPGQC